MRTRFDGLAKDALGAALERVSTVSLQHAISADPQYIDVVSEPDPARAHERHRLGLLGRMTEELCALEPYHQPPGEEEVFACVRKQVTWHHLLTKKARAADADAPMARFPLQWVLSAGRPARVLEAFEMTPLGGEWPDGVYTAVRWLRLRLVVVSELPRTPETLLLRLLGAGATLREAMRELLALPPDAWERLALVPLFLKFRFELPQDPSQRTPEEEELIVTGQEYVDRILNEGERKGRSAGMEAVLTHLVERRLTRPLSDAERTALRARIADLGGDQVSDMVLDLAPDALAAWLAPSAA